ncbi:MAG: hypothetical protein CHACPFDD_03268 [Phycisphaerae bacterium]|nr:hypothetical protein [Phycisphaerae bacterium]
MSTWRYRVALLAVCAALAARSDAQVISRHSGPSPLASEVRVPDEPVELPLRRDLGWAIVEGRINDKHPVRLIVDTGAPGIYLSPEFVKRLELPEAKSSGVRVRVASPGGKGLDATLHTIESLRLGDAEFRGLRALAVPQPQGESADGVLGIGMFAELLLTFDYPNGRLRIERGELPAANGRDIVTFRTPRQPYSHPVIAVNCCGQDVDFTLDTGMTGWFRFTPDVVKQCGMAQGPVDGPVARTVDRELKTQVCRLDGALKCGDVVFESPHGVVDDAIGFPLMGGLALEHFALTLDQKHHRLRFARPSKDTIVAPPLRTAGFRMQRCATGGQVFGVMSGLPAEKAGIRDGDVIGSINGRPVDECFDAARWEGLMRGESLRVGVQRGGGEEILTIAIRELLAAAK